MSPSIDDTEREQQTGRGLAPRQMVLRGITPGDSSCYTIDGNRITLGRDSDCDIRLQRERVSRRHAEFYRQGPLLAVRDLASTNGTWVDGARTPHAAIRAGALLRIGEFLGIFEEIAGTPADQRFAELAPGVHGGAILAAALAPALRIAPSNLPVTLVGLTGSGKERFAYAVHASSGRSGAFRAVNCAALPAALAEAELFGFRKGAFTSAERTHTGHLLAAQGGTLFLDEVADLPLEVQPKLLRALEQSEFTSLGDSTPLRCDARFIVATQTPLQRLVDRGGFRADLANRLTGLVVNIPSLAERRADIPSLFLHFLALHSGGRPPRVCVRLFERLCLYAWPGNARELELLARNLLAMHGIEGMLHRSHLPEHLLDANASCGEELPASSDNASTRNDYERERLELALRQSAGNVKAAAAKLGISRQRAYRLMSKERSRLANR